MPYQGLLAMAIHLNSPNTRGDRVSWKTVGSTKSATSKPKRCTQRDRLWNTQSSDVPFWEEGAAVYSRATGPSTIMRGRRASSDGVDGGRDVTSGAIERTTMDSIATRAAS